MIKKATMYPENDLYFHYLARLIHSEYSSELPDRTKRITLEYMNHAINFCDQWDTCMDIGGGNGHYLTALASKFRKAILVEIEKKPEQQEISRQFSNIEIFNSLIEEYTKKDKVDFILLADVFEHIPDITAFVRQISSIQSIGGVVYIMTPNPASCGPVTESSLHHSITPYGHIRHYPTHEICTLMQAAGYELMFLRFEEAPFRQKAKIILNGLSRRDKRWQAFLIYHPVRPAVAACFSLISKIIGAYTYRSELAHAHDSLNTRTQDLAFKKAQ